MERSSKSTILRDNSLRKGTRRWYGGTYSNNTRETKEPNWGKQCLEVLWKVLWTTVRLIIFYVLLVLCIQRGREIIEKATNAQSWVNSAASYEEVRNSTIKWNKWWGWLQSIHPPITRDYKFFVLKFLA